MELLELKEKLISELMNERQEDLSMIVGGNAKPCTAGGGKWIGCGPGYCVGDCPTNCISNCMAQYQ